MPAASVLQVTDARRVVRVATGHPTMQLITATGCTLTAVMAAFLAAEAPDPLLAVAHAMAIYGCACGRNLPERP